jgi:pyrimidine deaminase RibD-like protein
MQDFDYFLGLAIDEGLKSPPIESAYCVGAVLVDNLTKSVVSTGYSRELPGNTHAEECCFLKFLEKLRLESEYYNENNKRYSFTLYTTMEPCEIRLSGKDSCCVRTISFCDSCNSLRTDQHASFEIERVVVGVREPKFFVGNCKGIELLQSKGLEIILSENEHIIAACSKLNHHLTNKV